jgi:aminoglycoside phosphotransferase (APT) family kinase protein
MADFDTGLLEKWLPAHIPGFEGPFALEKFIGGQSNPTYRLQAANAQYVLRRKPFGPLLPSAHAVEREFKLISALHPTGFPVPRPNALCEDPNVIGAPFYVMDLVAGRNLVEGSLPGTARKDRRSIYEAMIDTLASLHALDPDEIGLGDYGRPGNFFERQVSRWTKQYRASQTDDIREMEQLIEWLPATIPPQGGTTIVHGDYRLDNLIFADTMPRVDAVLDWELSTLGDPLSDFSYVAMNWVISPDGKAGIGGLDLEALGIPSLDEMVERYCVATGRPSVPKLDWYFAFNQFRLAAIIQGIKRRMIDGNASSETAAAHAGRVPELAALSWRFAKSAGAGT